MNDTAQSWWRPPWLAAALLAAVLVLAAALRLKGIAWGLPYSFLNADESTVMPIAFKAAQGHVDPGFFYYPSFYFYLVAAATLVATPVLWLVKHADPLTMRAFVIDPGPYFLIGRLVSVAFGVAAVYFVYRVGRAAFGRPAGLVAALLLAVAPLAVTYSHMAVTDMAATALALLAVWLLLEAAQGRGRRWLIGGAVAAGLATSTKYNLGALVLPATIAAVYASREEVARHVAAGAGAAGRWVRLLVLRVYVPMALAFVAGSPFVVLDARRFARDFLRQNEIMGRGWLGFEHVGNGFWYNLHTNLGAGIGMVLVVLGIAGIAWALWRRTRLDLMVAPYVVLYYLYISTWKELADRYLLPIAPLVILFAVRFCLELAGLRPAWRRVALPVVAAVLAVACVLPLASAVSFDRALSGTDTRALAKDWIERTIPAGTVLATENYSPQLVGLIDLPYYREAGRAQKAYKIVKIPLPALGAPNKQRSMGFLASKRVRYVIISSMVDDRVFAAAGSYPKLVDFYRQLEQTGTLVKEFRPGPGDRGPVLKIYKLPPAPQ
ncbi:MAG TPA: glycosyltransferase family 39 protein [Thermoleophilia bacterium]|nr:glycosyltransferase family 39 protein [Thermoleophilia bacterium]